MEAISYCRVSTEEQVKEGVSLAAQEARVWPYCDVAGLSLIETIRDEGVSAARPPYGFDREDEVLQPNPVEQAVIRQVQDWQRAGQSLRWSAEELARQQVPTKLGGQWYAGTVRYLLRDVLYAEEVAYAV